MSDKSGRPPPKARQFDTNGEKSFEVYQARAGRVPPDREFLAFLSVDGVRSPVNPFYGPTGPAAMATAARFWDAEVAKASAARERMAAENRRRARQ